MTLFADLPGPFTIEASRAHDFGGIWLERPVLLRVTQVPTGRVGVHSIPEAAFDELDRHEHGRRELEALLEAALEVVFRPWAFPDSETAFPWPTLIPFPKIHVLERLARSSRARRGAWLDARYLAARRIRAFADTIEGDQDLPARRRP